MHPSRYPTVGVFRNDTKGEMRLFLEMIPEEVVLSPGHSVELLAKPTPGLLPLTIDLWTGAYRSTRTRISIRIGMFASMASSYTLAIRRC